ncbi:MAG: hypothetical protein H0Z24_03370 [Thermosipho sp. (in: Bacteria)]|nr:hypothetical protein [Thermosipho sp. (in: thermotogales)]
MSFILNTFGLFILLGVALFVIVALRPVAIIAYSLLKLIINIPITIYKSVKYRKEEKRRKIFRSRVKAVNENKEAIEQAEGTIKEYSKEDSKKFGMQFNGKFKRPINLRPTGYSQMLNEAQKAGNKVYSEAMKNWVPLKYLYTENELKNKTIRVFVDTLNGKKAKLIDDTAVFELELDGVYGIAGEFVMINLDKEGDKFKINYILPDN